MGNFVTQRPLSQPANRGGMTITNHGGYCCGASHLSSFGDVADLETSLTYGLYYTGRPAGQFEIILTDDQMREDVAKGLAKMGWSFVNRFKNSNSGNYCNVFVINTGQDGREKILPYWAKHFPNPFDKEKKSEGPTPSKRPVARSLSKVLDGSGSPARPRR